ncbi:MAG TPA: hypothetical protein VNL77_01205 [Roseiflexaceae bacterium]|nr:hypothetical protein [Roseiflexaceae bacterium]
MKTVVGLFRDQAGVERAVEELRRVGVPDDSIRFVTRDSNLAVELGGPGGGHIFGAELARGGTLVVAEAAEELWQAAETVLRRAGAADLVVHDDADAGGWIGTREGTGAARPYWHAEGPGGSNRAEDSERNVWNEDEKLAYGADMGAGAGQGGTMGAPLGPGTTAAAGGPMGLTPGDEPADDEPAGMPNPERQADIERQRRRRDPAP